MDKIATSGLIILAFLSPVFGGAHYQELFASTNKSDTVLTDTILDNKIFFRVKKRKLFNDISKYTDVSLEGVTENDSTIFLYRDTVGIQRYTLQKIPSNTSKLFLLRIQTVPASPPSGNGFLVIAPVRGALKIIDPGRLKFIGDLPKISTDKSSDSDGKFSVHIWNGHFGIRIPLMVLAVGDSTFLKFAGVKSATVSKRTVYNFAVVELPDKKKYWENEDVTLYMDLDRKEKLVVKTPVNKDFEIQSVWVSLSLKREQHSIKDIFNDCEAKENALLQVKIGGKRGFISFEDFPKLGYPDAG